MNSGKVLVGGSLSFPSSWSKGGLSMTEELASILFCEYICNV
jgi:hypothetical protein